MLAHGHRGRFIGRGQYRSLGRTDAGDPPRRPVRKG